MNVWERQQLFRELAVLEMRHGPLTRRRRRQLVQYAACLEINAVQAGRLVEEACKIVGRRMSEAAQSGIVDSGVVYRIPGVGARRPAWALIAGIILAAVVVGALVMLSTVSVGGG